MTTRTSRPPVDWAEVRSLLRQRGLRWTPQRRQVLDVLKQTSGHITGSEVVERCRRVDPATTPSTVYRTLDVLEELGVVHHSHGADGREEFHVTPSAEHGHLVCQSCGRSWDVSTRDAATTLRSIRRRFDFAVDVSHLTMIGLCAKCRAEGPSSAVKL